MTESNVNLKPAYRQIVFTWWRFFWRTATLQLALLFVGGVAINHLSRILSGLNLLYIYSYHAAVITLIPLFVFNYVLGRRFRRSSLILVAATAKTSASNKEKNAVASSRLLRCWWSYLWRYALLVVCSVVAIKLGLAAAGINFAQGLFPPKWQMMCLSAVCIPASLAVFILLMRRKPKRRILDVLD